MNRLQPLLAAGDRLLDQLRGPESPDRPAFSAVDWLLVLLCVALGSAIAAWAVGVLGDVLHTEGSLNIWFGADNPRVLANLLDASSYQYRATVHPIFPILFTPWVSLLPNLGIAPLTVGKGVVVACAGASSALLVSALRFTGLPRAPSVLFTVVFMTSAAFLHWYSAIEIAPFNGLSMCLAVWALAFGRARGAWWWVMVSAFTLGVTITNWSAGLAATLSRWTLRRAIEISAVALAVVVVLSVAQKIIYPSAGLFFSPTGLIREQEYVEAKAPGWSPGRNLVSLVVYSAVAPEPAIEGAAPVRKVSNKHAAAGSAGWLGIGAMAAWLGLLACGAYGAWRHKPIRPVAFGLSLMLAAQVGLGLVYGDMPFLYAASIMPVLIMVAAMSWFTRARWVALGLAVLVATVGFASNARQFRMAADLATTILNEGGNEKWSRYAAGRFILPAPEAARAKP